MKFRKKPVVIEAIQWNGENEEEVYAFIDDFPTKELNRMKNELINKGFEDRIQIQTLEGIMEASVGDWIIKGVHGEFYPCKPDIFEKTYDKVIE